MIFSQNGKKSISETNIGKKNIQIKIYNICLAMCIQLGPLSYVPSVCPMALCPPMPFAHFHLTYA
jgi:hypothetical protein